MSECNNKRLSIKNNIPHNRQIFGTHVLLYSVARFIIEFFRGDRARGFIYNDFSIAQGISGVLFLAAIIFIVSLRNKQS